MKILLISRLWPTHNRSGVSLAAVEHVKLLKMLGHDVAIVGSDPSIYDQTNLCSRIYCVESNGSLALYSPPRINIKKIKSVLCQEKPDLVVVEAWQTVLTDFFIHYSSRLGFPVLMISHGVSVDPFALDWKSRLRAIAWLHYKLWILPGLIKKLSWITALDMKADSPRFYDRDLARKYGVGMTMLPNMPVHLCTKRLKRSSRKSQIIMIGYYSAVKNQLLAIDVVNLLRDRDITFLFVGSKNGAYYEKCVEKTRLMGLDNKIRFIDDEACSLGDEIGESIILLSTSLTEALPITIIEAMASGTPFVATPVGAVPSLKGGLMAVNENDLEQQITRLLDDTELWNQCSRNGVLQYENNYMLGMVSDALENAVIGATKISKV